MSINEQERALLKQIADATAQNSFVYVTKEAIGNLEALALVVGNPAVVDNAGNVAYRATQAGADLLAVSTAAPAAPAAPVAAPTFPAPAEGTQTGRFTVQTGFVRPEKRTRKSGGGANSRTYPFDKLEIGQCIFIPATDERPNPKKSLASTVSGANKRFSDHQPPRYFITEAATKGQVFGSVTAPDNGVFIVRIEPPVKKPKAEAAPAAPAA